ncbi:ATP-binding protein [Nonomuraea sp. NBC_00507]|uniref:ATP-binding protein n=1 Tax=Nonomuraea sp. NBC_00507 TaxID=2976002 RepID=UPI002E17D07F
MIRLRSTLATVVLVALALALFGMLLVVVFRATMTSEVIDDATQRATEIAKSWGRGPPGLEVTVPDEELIQVLDERGKVVAASSNVAGRPALFPLRPGESTTGLSPLDDEAVDPFVAAAVATPDGRFTVVVGVAPVEVLEATQIITHLLIVGLPVLLALIALATWRVVGRALAPVDAMRREADSITAARLDHRVPQPTGSDEIARLAVTLNGMLDRLESAQAAQRRFISDAAHELRSPVAAIRQHAEVALSYPVAAGDAELAATVHAETLRLQNLVEDLLLLARADERLPLVRTPVDLDDMVFAEARRLRTATTLTVSTAGVCAGQVYGDAAALQRMLRNLADNAARHARSQMAFTLGGDEDDGGGIPPAERRRVFERFVRLDDARSRDHGGSGLGLAIVAELVRAHGGTVSIGVGELGGALVTVVQPVFRSPLAP